MSVNSNLVTNDNEEMTNDHFCVFVTKWYTQHFLVTTTCQRHLHNPALDISTETVLSALWIFSIMFLSTSMTCTADSLGVTSAARCWNTGRFNTDR